MAFSTTINFTDAQQKALTAIAKSRTPNGQVAPTAQAFVTSEFTKLRTEWQAELAAINASRRAAAIAAASAPTVASVDTAIGLIPYEDLP